MSTVLVANSGAIAVTSAERFAHRGMHVYTVSTGTEAPRLASASHGQVHVHPSGDVPNFDPVEDPDAMLEVVRTLRPDYVFTGYGSLAEDPRFAAGCQELGCGWLGAPPNVLSLAQDKHRAIAMAARIGVPVLDHLVVGLGDFDEALALLARSPYGVVIKPRFGHGGAVRTADSAEALLDRLRQVGTCIVEPRVAEAVTVGVHVLKQPAGGIEGLAYSRTVHESGGRKLCESLAPADSGPRNVRASASAVVEQLDLAGAATVEFLMNGEGTYSFLEVNTRLPLSFRAVEAVSGVDLITAQLDLARGLPATRLPPRAVRAVELRVFADSEEDKAALTLMHDRLKPASVLSDAGSGEQGTWLLQCLAFGPTESECLQGLQRLTGVSVVSPFRSRGRVRHV